MQPADGARLSAAALLERAAAQPAPVPDLTPPPPPLLAPAPASATDGTPFTHSANLIEELYDAQQEYELTPYIMKNTINSGNAFAHMENLPTFHPSMSPKEQYQTFIYPSLCSQNMKCTQFVQMAATCQTTSGRIAKYKCRCSRCTNVHCEAVTRPTPRRRNECDHVGCSRYTDSCTNPDRNQVPFRCNIATFCNQFTMTRELPRRDAACAVCLGVDADCMAVAADCPAVHRPPKLCSRILSSRTGPRATLESTPCEDTSNSICMLNLPAGCGGGSGRGGSCSPPPRPPPLTPPLPPGARWDEPERDCGPEAVFTCTTTTTACTTTDEPECLTSSHINISTEHSEEDCCNNNRRILYNEGISDDVFAKLDCRNEATQECWQRTPRPEPGCCAGESWIPYSHRSSSKYHEHCKRSAARPHRAHRAAPAARRRPVTLHYPVADDCALPASPSFRSPSCFRVEPSCNRQASPQSRSPPCFRVEPTCNRQASPTSRSPSFFREPPCNGPASPTCRAPQPCQRSPPSTHHQSSLSCFRPSPSFNRPCAPPSRRQVLTSERDIESFLQAFIF